MGCYQKHVASRRFGEEADISKLTAEEVFKYTPSITAEEKEFLKEHDKQFHFGNARLHRKMQVTLRTAIFEILILFVITLYFRKSKYSTRLLGLWIVSGISSLGQAD